MKLLSDVAGSLKFLTLYFHKYSNRLSSLFHTAKDYILNVQIIF